MPVGDDLHLNIPKASDTGSDVLTKLLHSFLVLLKA